jgi:O-antigen biosynthesis protein
VIERSHYRTWLLVRTIRRLLRSIKQLFAISGIPPKLYRKWIKTYDFISPELRSALAADIATWPSHPLVSIVMANCSIDCMWVSQSIESVRNQIYPHWELCISGNALTVEMRALLERYAKQDYRIRVGFCREHVDRTVNANAALALANGEYIALINAYDLLNEDALFWVGREIAINPDADLLFSDEDKIDGKGKRFDPYFKSAWNPALMLSQNAFSHLGVYRRTIVDEVGRFREGYDGAEEYDLVLRCAAKTTVDRIRHIPRVLYHQRAESISTQTAVTSTCWQAGQSAIADHLRRAGVPARVEKAFGSYYQVEYDAPPPLPLVSIIVPTTLSSAITARCLLSVLTRSSYNNFELLLLCEAKHLRAAESNPALAAVLTDHRTRLVTYEQMPFNFSGVSNLGNQSARGGVLCFLNDDVEAITVDWLERLVARLMLDGVGAVGPMLYYPSNMIQHAGILLGINGIADHPFNGQKRGFYGYFGRAGLEQDYSAVTAACLLVRRKMFDSLGGFDETLPSAYNDVDLCVRIRRTGARIVWTPSVEMIHHESHTFGPPHSSQRHDQFLRDITTIRKRWKKALESDPCYNPNLGLSRDSIFSLTWPPRILSPKELVGGNKMVSVSRTSQLIAYTNPPSG